MDRVHFMVKQHSPVVQLLKCLSRQCSINPFTPKGGGGCWVLFKGYSIKGLLLGYHLTVATLIGLSVETHNTNQYSNVVNDVNRNKEVYASILITIEVTTNIAK